MKKRPLRNLRQNKNGWERLPARRGWKPFLCSMNIGIICLHIQFLFIQIDFVKIDLNKI